MFSFLTLALVDKALRCEERESPLRLGSTFLNTTGYKRDMCENGDLYGCRLTCRCSVVDSVPVAEPCTAPFPKPEYNHFLVTVLHYTGHCHCTQHCVRRMPRVFRCIRPSPPRARVIAIVEKAVVCSPFRPTCP